MTRPITGATRHISRTGRPAETVNAPLAPESCVADRKVDVVVGPMGCKTHDVAVFPPYPLRIQDRVGPFPAVVRAGTGPGWRGPNAADLAQAEAVRVRDRVVQVGADRLPALTPAHPEDFGPPGADRRALRRLAGIPGLDEKTFGTEDVAAVFCNPPCDAGGVPARLGGTLI